jgi:hypothetical protein
MRRQGAHHGEEVPKVASASLRVARFVLKIKLLDEVLLQLVVHPRQVKVCGAKDFVVNRAAV